MHILAYTALAVALFFLAALYSVGQAERRRSDRRQQEVSCTLDQRHQDRRSGSLGSYLAWVFRSLGSGFRK